MLQLFNPIALRKVKIVNNFGLSECNRVKQLYVRAYLKNFAIYFIYVLHEAALFCYSVSLIHLTLLLSERPKLYTILAFLSAEGLKEQSIYK